MSGGTGSVIARNGRSVLWQSAESRGICLEDEFTMDSLNIQRRLIQFEGFEIDR